MLLYFLIPDIFAKKGLWMADAIFCTNYVDLRQSINKLNLSIFWFCPSFQHNGKIVQKFYLNFTFIESRLQLVDAKIVNVNLSGPYYRLKPKKSDFWNFFACIVLSVQVNKWYKLSHFDKISKHIQEPSCAFIYLTRTKRRTTIFNGTKGYPLT